MKKVHLMMALAMIFATSVVAKEKPHAGHVMVMTIDTEATKAFKQSHAGMMKDVPSYTGNVDADFRLQMIPHHQGAIDMARVVLKYSKDEETRKLAQDILSAQEKEITDMKDWLKQNVK